MPRPKIVDLGPSPADKRAARAEASRQRRTAFERARAGKAQLKSTPPDIAEEAESYAEARREGKEEERAKLKARREKSAETSKPVRRRRKSRRLTEPLGQGADVAVRQLQAPVRRQVTDGLRTIGLALAVIALYLFLTSASKVVEGLGAFERGFAWLSSPDRSIPFVKEN